MPGLWLAVVLALVLVTVIPAWPYSRAWGYGPAGAAAALLVVVFVLIWLGVLAVT